MFHIKQTNLKNIWEKKIIFQKMLAHIINRKKETLQ